MDDRNVRVMCPGKGGPGSCGNNNTPSWDPGSSPALAFPNSMAIWSKLPRAQFFLANTLSEPTHNHNRAEHVVTVDY